ncbi:hypothetical protein BO94DRAFT_601049 [Aspergillus sclerotioniger CBS 115572]|uniref:Protein NO VEIN C-terminal domain-containing protein n=1 Tax=Aspergillus sclerotioniger CBS 115572 TaxID=1450535 RepID=A0A317XBV8_9EURO|nr:hypothetical protein BO94DRAFT_601049 [Aspergillus sclerotioniger CBS 115572]PWY95999.1 hypothetical protein BO94DRAFT_601049 [Aspergillus sclerotioniger CBS 115572]
MDRQKARELIEGISKQYGYLNEDVLSQMSADVRRQVVEAMLKKDKIIASSVMTLSKNLYSSSARFVFELLQNADDNHYTTIKSRGIGPPITFHVYPRRIVVDCNEDGFTHEDIVAICNVGKSSKMGAQGYIGDKGIGFKSVFMVAWKVHIQSGNLSFSFQHKPGYSGMGMITPVWEEGEEQLEGPLTRMTLYLQDDEARRQSAMQQFRDLQDTLLLFIQEGNRKVLRKTIVRDGKIEELTQHYYFTKYLAQNLPPSENRRYTRYEQATKTYSKALVMLAFPLTQDSIPIIEQQDVFVFLPIGNMGFTFLIHSDFVTNANRQNIIYSSARNCKLRAAVANAFNMAVLGMCNHPLLRYTWMRYLPTDNDNQWDPFWARLLSEIKDCLRSSPILQSHTSRSWLSIETMLYLKDYSFDKSGDPLFPDLPGERYLSSSYDRQDIGQLKEYGLQSMHLGGIHSRAAKILAIPFVKRCPNLIRMVKALPLIPLMTGHWVSIREISVHYSSIGEIPLPRDLGLALVNPDAENNPQRRILFEYLGVREASIDYVRGLILERFKSSNPASLSPQMSRSHLVFLYRTTTLFSPAAQAINIQLFDDKESLRNPKTDKFYFPHDDPWGAKALLEPVPSGAPGLEVSYINKEYLHDPPSRPPTEALPWNRWLQQACQVRDTLSLTESTTSTPNVALGREFLYVAQHRPERFMGLLAARWPFDGPTVVQQPDLVLYEDGTKNRLSGCYIPTPALKGMVSKFMRDNEFFPWLHLDLPFDQGMLAPAWAALTKALSFGSPESQLDFYLDIMNSLCDALYYGDSDPNRMFDLYVKVQMECHASVADSRAAEKVRNHVYRFTDIWIPPQDYEAPRDMKSKYPLESLFEDYCRQNPADAIYLKDFFQKTLQIPNVGADDFLSELRMLQSDKCNNFDQISTVYIELRRMCEMMSPETADRVRYCFANERLIYVASGWYTVPECLWSTCTSISGRTALNDHYHGLREFFVDFLGVQRLTMQMVVERLRDLGLTSSSVDSVKETMWTLNALIQTDDSDIFSPEAILNSAVFPVRSPQGGVQLQTYAAAFGIADRKHLLSHFSSKAKLLDFEVDEIPRLEPFILWSGLWDRYLSCCVKEITMVDRDAARPLSNPDRDIRPKAHGLLRFAVHLQSPRAVQDEEALYETLKTISMKETNGILSELRLHQDGMDIKVEISRSELHLDARDGRLTVYISEDRRAQDICFLDRLPVALLQWMKTDPSTQIVHDFGNNAITVMQTLLHPYNNYVSDLLDRAGIMSIAKADDATVTGESRASKRDPPSTAAESSGVVEYTIFGSDDLTSMSSRPRHDSLISESTLVSPSLRSLPMAQPSTATLKHYTDTPIDPEYLRLLSYVLEYARGTALPSQGAFDMTALDESITTDSCSKPYQLQISDQWERDSKIGAAGELFVFELLSRLDPHLPAFTRDNWKSKIRRFVTILPEYSTMTAWHGRETADIAYDDHDGVLTSLFIDKGYLREDIWRGETPRFHIDVKSSTGACQTPFYMSKHEYRRMQEMSNGKSQSENADVVYVIFRVYDLGQRSMNVKVYVDPEVRRVREELVFTAESWSVVPS